MSRLIDADELERAVMSLGEDAVCDDCACEFVNLIDAQPTIEAEPARHGHWINIWDENDPNTSTYGRCTECGQISKRPLGRYCRWCGAKMDEVSE